MSTFNATINIGNRGTSLLTFDFYGCTGFNPAISSTGYTYLTGCTLIQDNVSYTTMVNGNIMTLTGLTYDPIGSQVKYIRVEVDNIADGNAESFECLKPIFQNIQISGIPTYTPTPLPATVTPIPATNTPLPATSTPLPATSTPLPATVTPNPATNTPTPNPATNTPTPTPTVSVSAGVSQISLSSGTTVANACTGSTQTYFYSSSVLFTTEGTQIFTDSNLTTPAPGTAMVTIFYYSSDYNTVYMINGDGNPGSKYDSSLLCPTPTPTTGTVTNAVVSLVDGPTACSGGDYDDDPSTPGIQPVFFNLIVYGSNIVNATKIIEIPSFLLGSFGADQEFYVRGRVAPDFYWKKFILDGSPSDGVTTATADGAAVLC